MGCGISFLENDMSLREDLRDSFNKKIKKLSKILSDVSEQGDFEESPEESYYKLYKIFYKLRTEVFEHKERLLEDDFLLLGELLRKVRNDFIECDFERSSEVFAREVEYFADRVFNDSSNNSIKYGEEEFWEDFVYFDGVFEEKFLGANFKIKNGLKLLLDSIVKNDDNLFKNDSLFSSLEYTYESSDTSQFCSPEASLNSSFSPIGYISDEERRNEEKINEEELKLLLSSFDRDLGEFEVKDFDNNFNSLYVNKQYYKFLQMQKNLYQVIDKGVVPSKRRGDLILLVERFFRASCKILNKRENPTPALNLPVNNESDRGHVEFEDAVASTFLGSTDSKLLLPSSKHKEEQSSQSAEVMGNFSAVYFQGSEETLPASRGHSVRNTMSSGRDADSGSAFRRFCGQTGFPKGRHAAAYMQVQRTSRDAITIG